MLINLHVAFKKQQVNFQVKCFIYLRKHFMQAKQTLNYLSVLIN